MIRRVIALVLALALTAPVLTAGAYYMEPYEYRKIAAHTVAETARSVGYAETSDIIRAAQADGWAAQNQIDADLDLLAVTTASIRTDLESEPLAGQTFAFRPGVRGRKTRRFGQPCY